MKCLSVKQPFASWILQGIKPREIRTYKVSYRGPLLIHSSNRPDVEFMKMYGIDSGKFLNGFILGMANFKHLIQTEPQHVIWIMEPLHIFKEPIKYKGRLNLHDITEEDIWEKIKVQLKESACSKIILEMYEMKLHEQSPKISEQSKPA